MAFPTSYDEYIESLDSIGESILIWADPDKQFRGYTEVGLLLLDMRMEAVRNHVYALQASNARFLRCKASLYSQIV